MSLEESLFLCSCQVDMQGTPLFEEAYSTFFFLIHGSWTCSSPVCADLNFASEKNRERPGKDGPPLRDVDRDRLMKDVSRDRERERERDRDRGHEFDYRRRLEEHDRRMFERDREHYFERRSPPPRYFDRDPYGRLSPPRDYPYSRERYREEFFARREDPYERVREPLDRAREDRYRFERFDDPYARRERELFDRGVPEDLRRPEREDADWRYPAAKRPRLLEPEPRPPAPSELDCEVVIVNKQQR